MNTIDDVVKNGLCIGCGVCAYSDAVARTEYSSRRAQHIPLITPANRNDAIAYEVCPGKGYDILEEAERLYADAAYDVQLGRTVGRYAAFSNDPAVLRNASSGGVMTQIGIFLLESNLVDRVLTTDFVYGDGPRTVCRLSGSKSEILRSQGSKYCPVDLSEAIREIKANRYRVAVVGTPCQIAGIRNIQRRDPEFSRKIVMTIGNFCGGIKSYRNISLLARRRGIDPRRIEFFRFRGDGQPGSMLIQDADGRRAEVPYPAYVGLNGIAKHRRCHGCVDATGELADIACGDAWLPRFQDDVHPWSVVMTRNRVADDLVRRMIAENVLTTAAISADEIKLSQRENLKSKKVRQKSRLFLYRALGIAVPTFDGGYLDNRLDLWTEIKVLFKHTAKQLLEDLHLFALAHRWAKGRS